jgi:hypothetical protein
VGFNLATQPMLIWALIYLTHHVDES